VLDIFPNLWYYNIVPRGSDDHPEEIFGRAVKKRTRISTPEGWLIRRGHKIFSKTFEKPLDKKQILCYNKDVPRKQE